MGCFRSADVRQLLHNKFVVVLGDSIQRSVYKDLVKLLQEDTFLSEAELKEIGKMSFATDTLVEGGELTGLHNGITYREVRQYRTSCHLVRFYFLTRVYSTYMESILSDFQSGPQPDVVIVSSCIWDLNRYEDEPMEAYKTNLDILFQRLKEVLSPECLIIWKMTMPVGYKAHEILEHSPHNLRRDIVVGNFFSATLANFHNLDVLDMHYHFRSNLHLRWHDAIHWNYKAHRKYTQILLTHIACSWGVEAPKVGMPEGPVYMPGYTSFDGNGIDDVPGVQRSEESINSNDVSPFVTDSPLLTADIRPGYFLPTRLPPPDLVIIPYPIHAPYPWSIQRKSKRGAVKLRGNRIHPY